MTQVYRTKERSREWFIGMDDPKDVIFELRMTTEKQADDIVWGL